MADPDWLGTAADVLAEADPVRARSLLTDALVERTHAGLVSRITLSDRDPLHVEMEVSGSMYHPGPEMWPGATQIRAHPLNAYLVDSGDTAPTLLPDVMANGWPMDETGYAVMRDLRLSEEQLSVVVGAPGAPYDGWVLVAEEAFRPAEVEEVTAVQPLLRGLDAHVRLLARAVRGQAPDADTPGLSPRERVVLTLLAEGRTAEAMARRLGISPRTVHKHQEHLYRKLGAVDRLSAVLAAQRRGLLPHG